MASLQERDGRWRCQFLYRWLAAHPGGQLLFALAEEVGGGKKRSRTTGHPWKDRPGAMKERLAGITERPRPGIPPLTEDEVGWHFKKTLKASEWG